MVDSKDVFTISIVGLDKAKEFAVWGTYGKDGIPHCNGTCPEHQLRFVRLVDCDTEHLRAILAQPQVKYGDYYLIIHSILKDRGEDEEEAGEDL